MGSNTTNGYFYKPTIGASGATELALFDAKLDVADAAIAARQPLDTGLTSIAALTTAANKMIYTTALDTYAVASLSAFARTILDDADASTVRTTLGLAIGTNVQAYDAQLADIAALAVTNDNFIVGDGTNWVAESGATARTSLGLGSVENTAISTWAGSTNMITLGTIATGTWEATDVGLTHGGTGVSTGAMVNFTSILNTALYIGRDIDNQIKFATDNTILFRLAGVDGATFISTGELDMNAHSVGFTLQTTTGDGTTTIDWRLGNHFKFTFGAQADTLTFTAPTNPCHLYLIVKQDGTGGRDLTFPVTVAWLQTEPTWTDGGANKVIIVGLVWDGTTYWAGATEWEA